MTDVAPATTASSTTFAVVVTCYNYRDFVVEAVDSALAQSRPTEAGRCGR